MSVTREALTVSGISKAYGEHGVLSDISITVREREILGVIGPSGGGKSTLLKCLDFLEVPTAGLIHYHGVLRAEFSTDGSTFRTDDAAERELTEQDLCVFRRRVGFVFQAFNLWEERTVLGNLVLAPIAVLGVPRPEAEERARILANQFGLGERLKARIQQLSGGERQRVAIIRALMMQPRMMLLDEVTSALDPVLTVDVMQAILELRERGMTMIVVTHHLEFASELCDRIVFLSNGRVAQSDTPENLRKAPATAEIAAFLAVLQRAR